MEKKKDLPGSSNNHLFPVFLKLEELRVLLVGAGKVRLEKLSSLLTNSPATAVHIVATEVSDEVRKLASFTCKRDYREKKISSR